MVVVKAYVTAGRQPVNWINWFGTATAFKSIVKYWAELD
jgi:hypothetical protein